MNKEELIRAIANEAKMTKTDTVRASATRYSDGKSVVSNRRDAQAGKAIKNAAKKVMKYKSQVKKRETFLSHGDLAMVERVRRGVKQADFKKIATSSPFTVREWSDFLNLTERTIQRYRKQKKTFAPPQSEKILEIGQLNKKGIEVFEDKNNFKFWLESKNVALGGMKPKDLLDTSIGIGMVKDELIRIEYGVLA